MKITVTVVALGVGVWCSVLLLSCAVSPPGPAAQYRAPPPGPDEEAVAQAFETLVQAYGRRDWEGVMAMIADDAQIESTAPDAAGRYGIYSPRVVNKREFGEAIRPIVARSQGSHVENVTLVMVSPTQAQVSGTMILLLAGRPPLSRDRQWVFEKRGERWLVVRSQYL
jgi:hypothetical protein